MSNGSYDLNLGSKRLILARDIRPRSWPNIGDSYGMSYSQISSYTVFGSWKKLCIWKTVHHEVGKKSKNLCKIHIKCSKFSRYADLLQIFAKNQHKSRKNPRISSVFRTAIQYHVSPRPAHIEVTYFEALLYMKFLQVKHQQIQKYRSVSYLASS